ncbi:HMCN1 [Symbiodinium natans]|uniref:HMCN1 protein n=1 Tax=Symbiodinium natans TaxID=878477 RepID=A0A812LH37_9DINO|nr:HMCN1 [Symbiodinium natans]
MEKVAGESLSPSYLLLLAQLVATAVEVQRHNASVQDAAVEPVADGKVPAAPDAPVVVETAQQAAQATASMAAAEAEVLLVISAHGCTNESFFVCASCR